MRFCSRPIHVTFVQINQLKKKREGLRSPWTRKFSGRGDVTPICSSEQGKLVQIEDEVKALDKTEVLSTCNPRTNKCSIRPTHGRANAYASLNLLNKTRPTHGRGSTDV